MSDSLRVLTIGHSYVVGLNQAVAAQTAKDPNIDLTLAAPTYDYGDLRRLRLGRTEHPDYKIVPLNARLTRWKHIFWYERKRLSELIANGNFDIVHNWEEPYTVAGYQIANITSKAGITQFFWTAQNLVKNYPWPFSKFERTVFAKSQCWVACGELVRQAMVEKGYAESKSHIIPLAVDTNHFHPIDEAERSQVHDELSLAPPVIGFSGRLVADKGLEVLMKSLERVENGWSLLALGSGPYREKLLHWAASRGLNGRIKIMLADHNQVARYIAALDVMVAPSLTTRHWKEQFGRMITEAFACGVPVVASDSGEIPYVVADAGVVVPEGNSQALAAAIDDLLSNPARRGQLARAGRARAESTYSVPTIANQYIQLYHKLAEQS